MKSADPDVIDKVSKSLSRDPIDAVTILEMIPEDNRYIVSAILDYAAMLNSNVQETREVLNETKLTLAATQQTLTSTQKILSGYAQKLHDFEVQDRAKQLAIREQEQTIKSLQSLDDKRVNQTTLSHFFLNNEHLVEDFSLNKKNLLVYKEELLDKESNAILHLSIELEKYFGNKNIHISVVINALKRYLVTKEKNATYFQDFLVDLVEEYLSQQTTKARTRVALSYLRKACSEIPELDVANIKSIMYNAGYIARTDKSNKVFFYRDH